MPSMGFEFRWFIRYRAQCKFTVMAFRVQEHGSYDLRQFQDSRPSNFVAVRPQVLKAWRCV